MEDKYPLAIDAWVHDDGKTVGETLVSKGHHDAKAFRAACAAYWGADLNGFGYVRHCWFRAMPDSNKKYSCFMSPAKPNSRGAFPATCISEVGRKA